MLKFITGAAGTGKSTRLREEITALAQSGKPVICLVPEQYSFETERILYPTGAAVYSMERLSDAVFRACGGLAGEYAGETFQLLLMRQLLADLKGTLTAFEKTAARPDFAAEMLRTLTELKRAGLTPSDLLEAAHTLHSGDTAPGGLLELKLNDLALILEGYNAELSRSYLDPAERLTRAAKKIREHGFFQGTSVFVDEYKSFTAVQMEILSLAIAQADDVTVSLCIDNERTGSGIFEGLHATRRALKSAAAKAGVPVTEEHLTEPKRFRSPSIAHLGEGLFAPAPAEYSPNPREVRAYRLDNEFDEASFAAAEIRRLVREEGYRYEDIAVLARDMQSRAPSLEAAFDRYGVPLFIDGGRTVEAMPLTRFVRRLLMLALRPLDREEGLMLLKCGILKTGEDDDPDSMSEDISAFEQYTYVWDLTGFSLRKPFERNPSGFSEREMTDRDREKLAGAERMRKLLVGVYDDFRAAYEQDGIARGIYRLLTEYGADKHLQAECDRLLEEGMELDAENLRLSWDSLMGFLDAAETLRRVRSESGEEIGLSGFLELFTSVAAATPLVTRPQTLDSVIAGDPALVRIGEKKCLLILGCNEGIFPRQPESDGTLTTSDREKLVQAGLPVQGRMEEKLCDERFAAYKAITSPSEQLVLTYAAADVGGSELSPSEIILSLQAVFPGIAITQSNDIDPLFYCDSPSTAFLQAARLPDGTTRQTLEKLLEAREGWGERLHRLDKKADKEELQLHSPELSRMLFAPLTRPDGNAGMTLSPSQIEQYYSCPFAYFCRYGLGIRSPSKAELNPLARGSIIHFLLQGALSREDFQQLDADGIAKLTLSLLAEYLDKALGGTDEKSGKFLYYFYRLNETVTALLTALQQELNQTEFTVCGLEEAIAAGGKIRPLTVEGDGLTMQVMGKVDRIDQATLDGEEYIRVIDYKTGNRKFKLEDAERGLNLQMLLYLFAAEKEGAFAGSTPAGILYMPAGAKSPEFGRGEGGSEKIHQLYRMNGLVLDEERVLRAMERDGSGSFIVPPGRGNTGRISREELEGLREKAEGLVREMGAGLMEGKIAPKPQGYGNTLPCTWCEYKVACRR